MDRDSAGGTQARLSRRSWWLAAGGLATATVIAIAAGREPSDPTPRIETPAAPAVVHAPLRVDWGGCTEVRWHDEAPRCLVGPDTTLRLWIEGPPEGSLEVLVDDRPTEVERYTIDGEPGHGLRVPIPASATAVLVRTLGADASDPRWSLALGPAQEDEPEPEPLAAARKELGRALGQRDADGVRRATERALDLALADGRLGYALDLGLGVVFELGRRRLDPGVANALLERLEEPAQRFPKGRGDLAAYRGLHHWHRGAIQEAAESLRDAARVSARLQDATLAADAVPMYAETLAELGYFEDARRFAREGLEIVRGQQRACDLGSALRTSGWVSLRLRQRGSPHDDPAPLLEEALRIFGDDGACPRPDKLGGARLSLALLALEQGLLDVATVHLQRIDRDRITLDERVLVDDTDVRVALAQGDLPRARAALAQLGLGAEAAGSPDARWRAHTRQGALLEREGDRQGAIAAQRRAEDELDVLVRLQAVGLGRGELADRYRQSTEALVGLLVQQGETEAAWCLVREDQARRRAAVVMPSGLDHPRRAALEHTIQRYRQQKLEAMQLVAATHELPRDEQRAGLDAAARVEDDARALANALAKELAQLAPRPRCTELTPAAPGELLLGLYPAGGQWWVFASDARATTVRSVPAPTSLDAPERLAEQLLEPVAAQLEPARSVRVLAHGDAQTIDVHELPWRGEPLGVRLPVAYGVELPQALHSAATDRRALLIADPTDTLEGASAEVTMVDQLLRTTGWSTTVLSRDQLSAPGTASIAGFELFHYAGHAQASAEPQRGDWPPYEGGGVGWAAFLELGPAGRLTVHDVLTTHTAPRVAVLAACRTGAVELDTGQLTLALAFLAAGGEQVVASASPVEDQHGARLATPLYDALIREPPLDLVQAMAQVERARWDAGEPPTGYRVWVR